MTPNNPDPVQLRAYAQLLELGIQSEPATEAAIVALRFQAAMIAAAAQIESLYNPKQ